MPNARRALRLTIVGLFLVSLAACKSADGSPDASSSAKQPPTDAISADEAIARLNADPARLKGQRIKVWGYYRNYTSQGDLLNVSAAASEAPGAKGPLCQFPANAKAELDKLRPGKIAFSGVVDGEFFGSPRLKDCKLE
jgi:hypothetical protein